MVFLYDMVGYNDSKPFGHAFLNDRLRRWGLSLATLDNVPVALVEAAADGLRVVRGFNL